MVEKRAIPPYETNVDGADTTAPDGIIYPPALPSRGPSSLTATGDYKLYCTGCLGGIYELFYEGTYVAITGSGYISVNWDICYGNSSGHIRPPSWNELIGKLWHVASGSGHRMDDTSLNCDSGGCCTSQRWFGCPGTEYYDTLPSGATQMWQIEYCYPENVNVTLHDNENSVDYNLGVSFPDWATTDADIRKTGNKHGFYNPVLQSIARKGIGLGRGWEDQSLRELALEYHQWL